MQFIKNIPVTFSLTKLYINLQCLSVTTTQRRCIHAETSNRFLQMTINVGGGWAGTGKTDI